MLQIVFLSFFLYRLLFLQPCLSKFQLDANETEGRKYRIRPDFKEDPLFRRLTDHNHTAVHIPTDIYDGCEYTCTPWLWLTNRPGVRRLLSARRVFLNTVQSQLTLLAFSKEDFNVL